MDRPKLQDCKFFLEGSCKKGFSCPFRHSEEAKNTNKPCFKWLKQQCASESCPYRHEALHAEGSQQQAKPHPKPRPQQQPSPFDIMLKKQQKQQKKQQQQQQQPSPFDMLKKQQKQQKKQQQQQPPAFDMLKKQQKQQKKQQQQQPSPFDMLKKQQKQQKKQQQQQQQQQRKPPVSVPPPNEVHSPFAAPAFEKQGVVGYFWDMENCSVPRGANGFEIVQNIRRKVQSLVPGLQEKVFVAAGKFNMQFPQEVLAAVQRAGVRLAHSADPKRDSADWLLRDELDDFQNYHKPPGNISWNENTLLISLKIFSDGCSDLRRQRLLPKDGNAERTIALHHMYHSQRRRKGGSQNGCHLHHRMGVSLSNSGQRGKTSGILPTTSEGGKTSGLLPTTTKGGILPTTEVGKTASTKTTQRQGPGLGLSDGRTSKGCAPWCEEAQRKAWILVRLLREPIQEHGRAT